MATCEKSENNSMNRPFQSLALVASLLAMLVLAWILVVDKYIYRVHLLSGSFLMVDAAGTPIREDLKIGFKSLKWHAKPIDPILYSISDQGIIEIYSVRRSFSSRAEKTFLIRANGYDPVEIQIGGISEGKVRKATSVARVQMTRNTL